MFQVDHLVMHQVEVSIPALNRLEVHLRVRILALLLLPLLLTAPRHLLVQVLLRNHPLNRRWYRQLLQLGVLVLNRF